VEPDQTGVQKTVVHYPSPVPRASTGNISWCRRHLGASELRTVGFDYLCVSSGGISPQARPAVAPGYQVPLAAAVKSASAIAVQAVGMIVSPHQAEAITTSGETLAGRSTGTRPTARKKDSKGSRNRRTDARNGCFPELSARDRVCLCCSGSKWARSGPFETTGKG
jgi:2,4-dienoyl-CoA reductase-like NADH-dependent reductase (Old Yellow Enzyme family)